MDAGTGCDRVRVAIASEFIAVPKQGGLLAGTPAQPVMPASALGTQVAGDR
jgi:hypothetical protein